MLAKRSKGCIDHSDSFIDHSDSFIDHSDSFIDHSDSFIDHNNQKVARVAKWWEFFPQLLKTKA